MKLSEIVFSGTENDPSGIDSVLKNFPKDKMLCRLNSRQTIWSSGNKYLFVYDEEAVGYISFDTVTRVKGKSFLPINMVYFSPRIRKTFSAGVFILGTCKVVDKPIIVGGPRTAGGVLSSDGAQLVLSLKRLKHICVTVLDFETGKERKIDSADIGTTTDNTTFVFRGNKVQLERKDSDLLSAGIHWWIFEDTLSAAWDMTSDELRESHERKK